LDVVIAQGATILQLFTGENQALLVGRYAWRVKQRIRMLKSFYHNYQEKLLELFELTLLVLNFGFHIVDRVRRFDLKGNGLTREGFHKDLHSRYAIVLFLSRNSPKLQ
jgi:hypothetical protein